MSEVKTPDEIWYRISEEDISCLQDYIDAALRGDESIEAIKRLVEQEWGIIRSRKAPAGVLEELSKWLHNEAKIAFEPETRAFMVRLNQKIYDLYNEIQEREP